MINKNILCIGKNVSVRFLSHNDYQSIRFWEDNEENFNYFTNTNFLFDIKNPMWISRKLDDKNSVCLVIVENKTQKIIGLTLLENIDFINKNACWGIYMCEDKFRKLTYSLESSFFIIDYAFSKYKLNKIYNNSLATNSRGRKFHKSLGFEEEAIFNNQIFVDGYYEDLIWSSINRDLWIKNKESLINKLNKVLENSP